MIFSGYTFDNKKLCYTVEPAGYSIYLDNDMWIQQREPHIPNKSLTYEQNAIAQIKSIVGDTADIPKTDSERLITIENKLNTSYTEAQETAVDAYTEELLEGGILCVHL